MKRVHAYDWAGTCFVCVLAASSLAAEAQENARPLSEQWGNLKGAWRFCTDPSDAGEQQGWQAPEFNDSAWQELKAPGNWEAQGVTEPRPGAEPRPKTDAVPWTDYDGAAWYRLRFVAPASWEGRPLRLYLGHIDDEDRTYINGRLVGEVGPGVERAVAVRRRYDIPMGAVKAGAENVLAIRVMDGGGPGGLTGPALCLLPSDRTTAMMDLPQSNQPLPERFANPPAESRILKIVHSLPDDPDDQDGLFISLAGLGFGGIVTNVSFTDYLESEERWTAFTRGVNEAKNTGMALWVYDERGYPSCKAGGLTLRDHPEWQAQGLLIADTLTSGGNVQLTVPPGELMRAAAFPIVDGNIGTEKAVDLSANVGNGELSWEAPAGNWHVMAVTKSFLHAGTHADGNLSDPLPYPNLLMPEPTARFIELTYGGYTKHLGGDLGKYFISTFTDEPSLMSLFLKKQPWRVLPWGPNMPGEFEKRRGYALDPFIPMLVADAGAKGRAVRYDFWLTVGELVSENYFGQIQEYCRAHNTLSGGHLLLEEPLLAHVALYGDFFRCIRHLSAPSMDCLTSVPESVPWFVARLLSSAAELEGRTVTMSETSDHSQRYRPKGDERPPQVVSEDQIRGTCNRLIINGITTITSYYSFASLSTEQMVRLNEWTGRCCTMLKGGNQVADVALLYPAESVWPGFVPSCRMTEDCPPDTRRIETMYRSAANGLYGAQRDFTYVDGRALSEATVENGVLKHGALEWRVIILPCADTLPMKAWENLAAFWRSGGVVVALSRLPANSEKEFPSPAVQAFANEMFGADRARPFNTNAAGGAGVFLAAGSESLLPFVLDSLLAHDVGVAQKDAPIRVTHRRIDGREVFFVINDSGEPWSGAVDFAVRGEGEQWDPATGKMTPLTSPQGLSLNLGPYGGMLFRFAEPVPPQRLQPAQGVLPGLQVSALPGVQPTVGRGEFVEATLTAEPNGGWRAVAKLTKSNVDTFMFAAFDYPQPIDLRGAACFVTETSVPEDQHAPTALLVILRDAKGVECIADTGRPLSTAGTFPSFVPLSQFERAGWSKGEGALDFAAVTGIRIGWGGYLGTEGETIEFTLSKPQIANLVQP